MTVTPSFRPPQAGEDRTRSLPLNQIRVEPALTAPASAAAAPSLGSHVSTGAATGPNLIGGDEAVMQLAELLAHAGTQTPLTVGLLGGILGARCGQRRMSTPVPQPARGRRHSTARMRAATTAALTAARVTTRATTASARVTNPDASVAAALTLASASTRLPAARIQKHCNHDRSPK
jgi:hypothetical protein